MSSSQRRSSEKSSSQETVHRARTGSEAIPEQIHRQSNSRKSSSPNTKASSSHLHNYSRSHRVTVESCSEKDVAMTSASKTHSSSSKKNSSSSSKSKSSKVDSWTDVTEPEERRRIQNRLAQRKFREKAKESKEQAERDARNQELAGSSYTVPVTWDDLPEGDDDGQCSGLPWGSISMRHVVSRSSHHHGASRQNDEDYYNILNDDYYAGGNYATAGGDAAQGNAVNSPIYQQSYGSHDNSSGVGGDFFDDGAYYYNTDYEGSQ